MAGSTLISSLAFSDLVDTTKRIHQMGEYLVEDLAEVKKLYKIETIPNNTGTQRIHDEYDTETYAHLKIEGGDATKVAVIKGWTKTATMRRFAAEIDLTHEMNKFATSDANIVNKMTSLSKYCPQRMALDLTHRFTFATSTSYTDMDGETVDVSMGSTTSTALVDSTQDLTGSTSTYSTVITGTPYFSTGAFQVARERTTTQVVSNFNERRVYNFKYIVTGDDPTTSDAVQQVMLSNTDVTQNNPGVVNVAPKFVHIKLPRLATTATGAYDSTKAKWWFYVAEEASLYLDIYEVPYMKAQDEDVHNDNITFGTRAAWATCCVVARGVLGSCP
jgi:hypothetical protein